MCNVLLLNHFLKFWGDGSVSRICYSNLLEFGCPVLWGKPGSHVTYMQSQYLVVVDRGLPEQADQLHCWIGDFSIVHQEALSQ